MCVDSTNCSGTCSECLTERDQREWEKGYEQGVCEVLKVMDAKERLRWCIKYRGWRDAWRKAQAFVEVVRPKENEDKPALRSKCTACGLEAAHDNDNVCAEVRAIRAELEAAKRAGTESSTTYPYAGLDLATQIANLVGNAANQHAQILALETSRDDLRKALTAIANQWTDDPSGGDFEDVADIVKFARAALKTSASSGAPDAKPTRPAVEAEEPGTCSCCADHKRDVGGCHPLCECDCAPTPGAGKQER